MQKIFCFLILFHSFQIIYSQQYEWSASKILLEIEKLNTTGSVLYIAAHPDDDNTRLIAYLANEKKVRTGYLSLTRGDGGQNLIGDEQGAYLGVMRTQELLEARKTDGGEQYFTRAVDFGYSKSADETFTKWNRDSLVSDMVWVIRNFRPDVIITRFPPDERAGHGQHTVSALLAQQAFNDAGDPNKFSEQLKYVTVWKPQRLFWNTSKGWDAELPEKIKNGDKNLIAFDDGGYNFLLGKSYGEISAESRTHHKSQGFGTTPNRGTSMEYLELRAGIPFSQNAMFDGIYTTWERYRQGADIKINLDKIIAGYDPAHPENSVNNLLIVSNLLNKLPSDQYIEYKKQQLQNILVACLALWIDPVAEKNIVATHDTLKVFSNVVERTDLPVQLKSFSYLGKTISPNKNLVKGKIQSDTINILIPDSLSSSPYWLNGNYTGFFNVHNQQLIGKAENEPALSLIYTIKIGDEEFKIKRAVMYKETDAVKGEVYIPLAIVPPATINLAEKNVLITNNAAKQINIAVKANAKFNGTIKLNPVYSNGENLSTEYKINMKDGEIKTVSFTVPEFKQEQAEFKITLNSSDTTLTYNNATYTNDTLIEQQKWDAINLKTIQYDHIPRQIILEEATINLIKLNTEIPHVKIAYIEGAGDKTDEALQEVSLQPDKLNAKNITADILKNYDVVLLGVRAYNTNKDLVNAKNILMQYVYNGGLVIAQYSNQDLLTEDFGPYKFAISSARVTDENSPVEFLDINSPILNQPNKITQDDFKGWIQERGLYFAGDIAPQYKTVLAFTDPNEKPQNGSIIIGDYGKGAYIYTGISFFRELPAGVPGAYRIFMNILSYKHTE